MEKDAPGRFKDWYNELTPEDVKLPLDWKKLDSMLFKKLLVLRCLRPDRITVAMTNFIRRIRFYGRKLGIVGGEGIYLAYPLKAYLSP